MFRLLLVGRTYPHGIDCRMISQRSIYREDSYREAHHITGMIPDNFALAAKGKKKKKFKKGSKEGAKQHDGEKKDMSKVKCFACQKMGHYAGQCPNKKKKKQQTAATA